MNYGDYLDLDTVLNSQNTVTSDRNELMKKLLKKD